MFPSSHYSLEAFFPSPQEEVQLSGSAPLQVNPYSFKQFEHPSSGTELPSSHSSVGCLFEFPQNEEQTEAGGVVEQLYPYSMRQLELQPSPPVEFPSSQVSEPSMT